MPAIIKMGRRRPCLYRYTQSPSHSWQESEMPVISCTLVHFPWSRGVPRDRVRHQSRTPESGGYARLCPQPSQEQGVYDINRMFCIQIDPFVGETCRQQPYYSVTLRWLDRLSFQLISLVWLSCCVAKYRYKHAHHQKTGSGVVFA